MSRALFVIWIFLICPAICNADRYGIYDPTDESPPAPLWLILYLFAVLWLGVGKKSPLKKWADENVWLFMAIFLVAIPGFLFIVAS
jgi:hypothetical protein